MSHRLALYKWCRQNKVLKRDQEEENKEKKYTHLLQDRMLGGVLYVPIEKENDFIEQYTNTLLSLQAEQKKYGKDATHLYVNEMRTPVFRLFVDWDIYCEHELKVEDRMNICREYQQYLKKFYPNTDPLSRRYEMIICVNEMAKKVKFVRGEHRPMYKYGIHGAFPFLYVNDEQTLDIRENVIGHYYLKFKNLSQSLTKWEDIVDEDVYTRNTFRMIGSAKTEPCSECQASKKEKKKKIEARKDCICNGQGFVCGGRVYHFFTYFNSDGQVNEKMCQKYNLNLAQTIHDTCIRTTRSEPTPGFSLWLGSVRSPINLGVEDTKSKKRVISRSKIEVDRKGPQAERIISLIRNLHPMYKNILIKNIYTNREKTYYKVMTFGSGSRYCQNIQRDHNTNTIYFVIYSKYPSQTSKKSTTVLRVKKKKRRRIQTAYITQQCHCTCDTVEGRLSGRMCKHFETLPQAVSYEDYMNLFPFPALYGKVDPKIKFTSKEKFLDEDPVLERALTRVYMELEKMDFTSNQGQGKKRKNR